MAGIASYGAYVPLQRLERSEISRAWNTRGMQGEKAVANYDEDSVTMAVAACVDCMGDMNRQEIDGVFFATTTSPFKEKQAATIIARAIDLRDDVLTADHSSSLRAGTTALKAALDAVSSGSAKRILVVAADCRPSPAHGSREFDLGDGAAALLIDSIGGVARITGRHTIFSDLVDVWRTQEDTFVRSWEDRFIIDKGYLELTARAAKTVMAQNGLTPKDITKAVLYGPDPRSHQTLARLLGLDPKTQVQDSLYFTVGNTGAAQTLMALVAALEEAHPGDKLLVASYGDGSDAFIVEATGVKVEGRLGVAGHLARKKPMHNYESYAQLHDLIPIEPIARPQKAAPSSVAQWRQTKQNLSLYGSKCNSCGKPQYPVQRVCAFCRSWDDFTPYRFSDKKGTLFTFSFDNLGFSASDIPPVGGGVVNFDGGGRVLCQLSDCNQEETRIDIPMEMTLRKLSQVEGIPTYGWKARPVR